MPAFLKLTTPPVAYIVRFETKNIFFYFEKRSSLLHTTLAL
jgi:hypothetical protein